MMTDVDSSKHSPLFLGERSDGRENNFDFLRFLFAVFVLFYHCYPIFYGLSAPNHGPVETLADTCGGIAVPFFFVISGFLVTRSWRKDPKLAGFLQKRILRIYPGFLVAALFCAVVVGPLGAADASVYWHQFQPVKFMRWAFVLVGPYIPTIFVSLPMSSWSSLIVYFLAGMVFYLYRDKIPFSRTVFLVCLGTLVLCWGFHRLEIALPVFGSYALFYLAFTRRLHLQRFARFGDFSYGLYLYAFPVQQLLVLYFGKHLNILTLFLSAFALTLGLAVISWHWVEKPCLRLKRHSSRPVSSRPEVASIEN